MGQKRGSTPLQPPSNPVKTRTPIDMTYMRKVSLLIFLPLGLRRGEGLSLGMMEACASARCNSTGGTRLIICCTFKDIFLKHELLTTGIKGHKCVSALHRKMLLILICFINKSVVILLCTEPFFMFKVVCKEQRPKLHFFYMQLLFVMGFGLWAG
ncbi:hypothetical protein QVD17_10458 [Tagetes erecta]|uniref:Uncharacterized protein n=1 Tax=Tagetes erecta TaxID=13708 RepID=A0AAD8P682_TARER|nr:hypothetical protein QVD17_10458 [Tagetes erecta]